MVFKIFFSATAYKRSSLNIDDALASRLYEKNTDVGDNANNDNDGNNGYLIVQTDEPDKDDKMRLIQQATMSYKIHYNLVDICPPSYIQHVNHEC